MSGRSESSLFSSAVVDHRSPPIEDSIIDSLIASESLRSPLHDYLLRRHVTLRQDSVNWILDAHAHFQFHPITAILSVDYFDRFLSAATSASLEWNDGWKFQLLSVACFSIAAKMEEPKVPSLLDLQVSEPRFVFESKSIQRMELLVMETLNWRLRSVTPFDFLHYFIFKLPQSSPSDEQYDFRWKYCSDLIVKSIRGVPAVRDRGGGGGFGRRRRRGGAGELLRESEQSTDYDSEMVRSCHRLMEEYLVDTCPSADHKVRNQWRTPDEPPRSPDGVLDAANCVSCDTRSGETAAFAGEHDREAKRVRTSSV
ncbi:hypothetical protein SSX86_009664 [Deinandra increscens subsp. villosa]|uniref:Cyclin-like domain-containing protein n=1 Tax=Deinandra increscens subsp. villosa TaxID=3103831 RepID=A0AAP0D9I8_9ASTR